MLLLGCRSAKDATCRIVPPKSKVTIWRKPSLCDVQATRKFALTPWGVRQTPPVALNVMRVDIENSQWTEYKSWKPMFDTSRTSSGPNADPEVLAEDCECTTVADQTNTHQEFRVSQETQGKTSTPQPPYFQDLTVPIWQDDNDLRSCISHLWLCIIHVVERIGKCNSKPIEMDTWPECDPDYTGEI
jgi:hypothetical protein